MHRRYKQDSMGKRWLMAAHLGKPSRLSLTVMYRFRETQGQ